MKNSGFLLLIFLTFSLENFSQQSDTFLFEEVIIAEDNGLQAWENIEQFYEDKNGILWCIIDDGLYRFNGFSAININNYLSTFYNLDVGEQAGVTFFIEQNGIIWYGERKGLYKINLQKKTAHKIVLDTPLHPPNWRNYILKLQLIDTILYVGTSNGLYLVNKHNNQIIKKYLTNGADIRHRNSAHAVESFYIEKEKNTIWTAMPDGFYKINTKTDAITHFEIKDAPYRYPHNFHRIIPDDNGFIFPTHGLGVVRFDTIAKQFSTHLTQKNKAYRRAPNVIRSMVSITDSIFLINAVELGNGLYNKYTHQYQWLKTPQPMKDGVFLDPDRSGYVWASKRGRIFKSIKPITKRKQSHKQIIDVTDFIANNELKSRPSIDNYPHIKLSENERNVLLKFSLSKSSAIDSIVYQYQLNSKKWEEINTNNTLLLNDLSTGKNEVLIRATDKKGNVLANRKLSFTIHQPFYKTSVFITVCILFIFSIIYLLGRYSVLRKTTKKLREIDRIKTDLITNISHEFRTPLTLISGPIENEIQREDLTDDARRNFEMIQRNTNRLLSLVDQLLTISKAETGATQLSVTQQNIIPFIGSIADSFHYLAQQKDLNYLIYIHPTDQETWFDADIIEKVVANLLSNAIKYTPESGSVICNVHIKSGELYFSVKNTGKGISKKEQSKIFDRFYQTNPHKEGIGIGLALIKELITLHNGTITLESIPNAWTRFLVIIPISKHSFSREEIHPSLPSISKAPPLSSSVYVENEEETPVMTYNKPILLIVDDNKDIRSYISTFFTEHYHVLKAKNGQEGIDFAIEHIPDIIISDVMMPVKDGIALCNALKNDERTSHIPIILLTAKVGEKNKLEGVKTGADDYINKPFRKELLIVKVEKLIEIRRKLQVRYRQEVVLQPKGIAITSVDEQFLDNLQRILDDQLEKSSFTIEDLCQLLGMSRMQLHRKLKALTGLSASEFIRSQRLKLASELLKKSDINISQVGYSVGFNDHAYFSKCFKKMYHCTPSEYQKKHRTG
ncbi:response regulator [Aquimarina hainanensis]|uniref:histidine kinase n=1 Tax=Aquimarina hainanensis TaxID=1578017 RepID=A0ABW5NEH4_9FLAO